jgi:hypothetical protein
MLETAQHASVRIVRDFAETRGTSERVDRDLRLRLGPGHDVAYRAQRVRHDERRGARQQAPHGGNDATSITARISSTVPSERNESAEHASARALLRPHM